VIANASGATPCNVGAGEREPGTTRLGLPLYRLDPPNRRGRLPRPDDGEYVAAQDGVDVKCGQAPLDPSLHPGSGRIRLFETFGCDQRLRVARGGSKAATARAKARQRGMALLLDRAERNSVVLEVDGADARIAVRGAKVRKLRVTAWANGERERLALDGDGNATLPAADTRTWLRIRARTKPGWAVATSTTALSR